MKQMNKSFSSVPALKNVHFSIKKGEIHALLGANGAGKSTLMKILSGAYTADSGDIFIDDKPVKMNNPKQAKELGIQCVYQEVDVALVPHLTVAENILLDRQTDRNRKLWISWKKFYHEAEEIIKRLGFSLSVKKKVEDLSLAEKQLVLIARAIKEQAKIVIFDEPTAPLSADESERLFTIMKTLRDTGVGCIFISHRLPEVFQICDQISVMRDGEKVVTIPTSSTTIDEVIENMLGKSLEEEFPIIHSNPGKSLLTVSNLSGEKVKEVNLHVREGEIVGIVGLVGAGKTELSKAIYGAYSTYTGEIFKGNKKLSIVHPLQAIQNGIVLVPEERRKEGILVEESINTNLSLPILSKMTKLGFISRGLELRHAKSMINQLKIKTTNSYEVVGHLSGGNQQKVAVGKWLKTDAAVYMFDEPTKGVDIGAKSEIYRLIGELAGKQKGILYFTSEIAEVLGIASRIYIMCDGKIVKELLREEASQEEIMYYASGGEEEHTA
ncbi:sugar ABC transporter ATP-binding protein [Bacillus salitolerans]|uniref:Autoinducer 2 import ATP-binding protein LsrA n=1 Tax=Bacillus salitolerans TaxID=1437434 RepID=A0ABW4LP35_9BACI